MTETKVERTTKVSEGDDWQDDWDAEDEPDDRDDDWEDDEIAPEDMPHP